MNLIISKPNLVCTSTQGRRTQGGKWGPGPTAPDIRGGGGADGVQGSHPLHTFHNL